VLDVMGGNGSQSVEFLQKLDALGKRRMEDRYGAIRTRPSGSHLGWVSIAAVQLSVAAPH